MNINVRDFEAGDENLFYDMAVKFHSSDAVAYGRVNHEALRTTFALCIARSPFVSGGFICCDEEVCGYGLIAFSYSNEYGGKIMIVDEVYVEDEFRNKGLAAHFIRHMISKYSRDVVYVEVEVKKDNIQAIGLYKKFDFEFNDYLLMYKFF